jgi:hypothetical protein
LGKNRRKDASRVRHARERAAAERIDALLQERTERSERAFSEEIERRLKMSGDRGSTLRARPASETDR